MKQNEIGNIIKNIRKKNNLTQQNLADKLGVTYQAVSKWENGKNIPDISILKEISKLYNIDINELLGNNKKKNNIYLIILLILVTIFITFLVYNNHNDFVFKTISSKCGEFKITGSIAYNQKKSSIYISNINYCGNENKEQYKKIKCYLYEKNNNNETKIAACDKTGKNTTLTNYLQSATLRINNYNLKCSKVNNNTLYLKIVVNDYDFKNKTFEIPLTLNNNCSLK